MTVQQTLASSKEPLILPRTPLTMQLLKQLGARQTMTVTPLGQGAQTVNVQMLQSQPSLLLSVAAVPGEKASLGLWWWCLCVCGGGGGGGGH